MSYASVAGSPHRIATNGSLALSSATGLVGHVLAPKPKDVKLDYRSAATVADQVLPALTASMKLLKAQAPGEADNFRNTVLVAVQAAAQAGKGEPTAPVVDMVRKITAALES